jgi:23S rRNA A2030 N6-methylase RlmJ
MNNPKKVIDSEQEVSSMCEVVVKLLYELSRRHLSKIILVWYPVAVNHQPTANKDSSISI